MNEPPLKILFVIDGLWVGGTERSLAEMLPLLAAAGIEPMVACFRRYPDEGVEAEVLAAGHDVRFLPPRGLARQVVALRRLIREERPRLLHSALFHANLVSRLGAAGMPVRVLNSLVNTPYTAARYRDPRISPVKLRLVQWTDAVTARLFADHFHAVSRTAREMAVRDLHLPERRITVVERGRDPRRLGSPDVARRQAARQALHLDADDEVLVNVGRHEYQKGQETLLRAVARLAADRPRLRLLVAGRSGAVTGALEALIGELGLADRVRLLGHRPDLPEVLAAADLFVFPSRFEGLPGAVIEAMALGLPIVASDIQPVREVVAADGNALLVPPESPAEFATAVARLLDHHDEATAFGARSRELFEERFTLGRSVRRMIDLYRRLAELT